MQKIFTTKNLILLVISFSLLISCKNKKETTETSASNKSLVPEEKSEDIAANVITIDRNYEYQPKGLISIGEITQSKKFAKEGNPYVLEIPISYGGGCKEHEFKMFSNGMYAKSIPPQIRLYLIDEQDKDFCKAMIYDTLYFELNNILQNEYKRFKIILNDNEEEKLELDFSKPFKN